MDKISTKTRKNQKFQPKISNFSENNSKSCCMCCTADGCRHRSEIVKSKHYQSTQFFKETFSDHNNNILRKQIAISLFSGEILTYQICIDTFKIAVR